MAWNEPGKGDKDPWGNRNDRNSPPDLDDVLKKMQAKLGGLFGGNQHHTINYLRYLAPFRDLYC